MLKHPQQKSLELGYELRLFWVTEGLALNSCPWEWEEAGDACAHVRVPCRHKHTSTNEKDEDGRERGC